VLFFYICVYLFICCARLWEGGGEGGEGIDKATIPESCALVCLCVFFLFVIYFSTANINK